jgi:hypothetical protein
VPAPDNLPLLIAISALIGFVVAARTWLLWRSMAGARQDVRRLTAELERGPARLRASADRFRGNLSDVNSGVERGLWSLARFDAWSLELEGKLRTRRAAVDEIRERYLGGARRGVASIRRTIRVLRQLIEFRRTFLG